mmetsp:Transcript_43500/g.132368  ORF Transcript_43500/g.132368 Transcript_43500/m.132368 type:complete len:90 (+) Transcript_43500:2116-2385(+)
MYFNIITAVPAMPDAAGILAKGRVEWLNFKVSKNICHYNSSSEHYRTNELYQSTAQGEVSRRVCERAFLRQQRKGERIPTKQHQLRNGA